MKKFPLHDIYKQSNGRPAYLKHINGMHDEKPLQYIHRDNYYIFAYMKAGYAKGIIDFETYHIYGPAIFFILPGQMHNLIKYDSDSWILLVDKALVRTEYEYILQSISVKSGIIPDRLHMQDLDDCMSMLDRRMRGQNTFDEITLSLISIYTGIIAEICSKGIKNDMKGRPFIIMSQFRALVSSCLKTMKSPSDYARELNITPAYLNEITNRISGQTATEYIQNEIIIQAKRMLFHTRMNIKEIAIELGYEDWSYFTRLFTRKTSMTPTQFRMKSRE